MFSPPQRQVQAQGGFGRAMGMPLGMPLNDSVAAAAFNALVPPPAPLPTTPAQAVAPAAAQAQPLLAAAAAGGAGVAASLSSAAARGLESPRVWQYDDAGQPVHASIYRRDAAAAAQQARPRPSCLRRLCSFICSC